MWNKIKGEGSGVLRWGVILRGILRVGLRGKSEIWQNWDSGRSWPWSYRGRDLQAEGNWWQRPQDWDILNILKKQGNFDWHRLWARWRNGSYAWGEKRAKSDDAFQATVRSLAVTLSKMRLWGFSVEESMISLTVLGHSRLPAEDRLQ